MDKLSDSTLKDCQRLTPNSRSSQSQAKKHRNVNISMTESFLENLDDEVEDSEYSSRSEYVREVLRDEVEGCEE